MPRFLDSLQAPLINRPRAVLELLEKEIGADFFYPEGDLHAVWQPRDIEHTVTVIDRGDFGLYLLYTAKVFDISDGFAGLEIASLLNRRQYGLTFVSIPDGNDGLIYGYSYIKLDEGMWTNLAFFSKLLQRHIGIVELVSRQKSFRKRLGLVGQPQTFFDGGDSAPLSLLSARDFDPVSPVFATGLWISELEASEFHDSMKRLLPYPNSQEIYKFPSDEQEVCLASDVRIEAKYAHGSRSDMRPVRDYDALVRVESVRHPELGWGIQEIQTFAYFAQDSFNGVAGKAIGDLDACTLANKLNHITYQQVLSNDLNVQAISNGSWVAHNDQIYYGRYSSATVLKDLADECIGAFGYALSLCFSPLDAVLRADFLVNYLRDHGLESKREPNPLLDHWIGCTQTAYSSPVISEEMQTGVNRSRYGADFSTPVEVAIASWGLFRKVPAVFTLELIHDPVTFETTLVCRKRYSDEIGSEIVYGPKNSVTKNELENAISGYFQNLYLPRIDWCQIQSGDYEESVRDGLRQYAHVLAAKSDVEMMISEIYQAPSPWELHLGTEYPAVFNSEQSVEMGFEWAVTLPEVVDRSISRLSMIFEHARLRKSGASDLELVSCQTTAEYFLRIRMGEIAPSASYGEFLKDYFDADDDFIFELLATSDLS
jgi:hypothetical protein